jgi:hypothetical protein
LAIDFFQLFLLALAKMDFKAEKSMLAQLNDGSY